MQDLGLQNGAKNLVGILYLQGPDTVRSIMTYFKSTVFALTQNLEMKTKLKLKRKNIYILKQISIDLSSEWKLILNIINVSEVLFQCLL